MIENASTDVAVQIKAQALIGSDSVLAEHEPPVVESVVKIWRGIDR